ncbi:beta-propeller fold lactonase family protein [Micrococcales bacterium 31B]|nr:beta-propeller fold lactonase family protein [Micrococcales bacterium 31B]
MSTIALGCYTEGSGGASDAPGRGVNLLSFDAETLELVEGPLIECASPSYVLWHPSGGVLYACHEQAEGQVSAYRVTGETPAALEVEPLGTFSTGGADPCHLALVNAISEDADAPTHLLVSNYSGGSLAVFPVLDGGGLGERTALAQHQGHSMHPERQEAAHVHQAVAHWNETDGAVVHVVDLGLDVVRRYLLDPLGRLVEHGSISLPPGAGPRQFVADAPVAGPALAPTSAVAPGLPDLRGDDEGEPVEGVHIPRVQPEALLPEGAAPSEAHARHVVLGELDSHLYLTNDGEPCNGVRTTRFEGENAPAHLLTLGRSLVVSNRGANTVGFLRVDGDELSLCAEIPVGAWPRHVEAMPGEARSHLLVSNQWGDSITVLRVEHGGGEIDSVTLVAEYGAESPSCIAVRPTR